MRLFNKIKERKKKQEEKRKKRKKKKRDYFHQRSKALQLYKKGTILLDVAIELDISAEEAKAFYHE